MQQQQHEELTAVELNLLNFLKSIEPCRTTVPKLAAYLEIDERTVYSVLESLRKKGYRIVSGKKSEELGTRIAQSDAEWHSYVSRREREALTSIRSITGFGKKDDDN